VAADGGRAAELVREACPFPEAVGYEQSLGSTGSRHPSHSKE